MCKIFRHISIFLISLINNVSNRFLDWYLLDWLRSCDPSWINHHKKLNTCIGQTSINIPTLVKNMVIFPKWLNLVIGQGFLEVNYVADRRNKTYYTPKRQNHLICTIMCIWIGVLILKVSLRILVYNEF